MTQESSRTCATGLMATACSPVLLTHIWPKEKELPPHLVGGLSEEGKQEEVCCRCIVPCLSAGCYAWALFLNKMSFVNVIQDKSGMLPLFVNMEL